MGSDSWLCAVGSPGTRELLLLLPLSPQDRQETGVPSGGWRLAAGGWWFVDKLTSVEGEFDVCQAVLPGLATAIGRQEFVSGDGESVCSEMHDKEFGC